MNWEIGRTNPQAWGVVGLLLVQGFAQDGSTRFSGTGWAGNPEKPEKRFWIVLPLTKKDSYTWTFEYWRFVIWTFTIGTFALLTPWNSIFWTNTSSVQKVSWGSHFKNGTRNGSKSLFKVSNCLFWSEEVLFKNVFLVFPDFRPNRFRKTGCFHPGQILGPRWDQWHLKHGDWSSQSSNSSLTLLLFIFKD